MSDPSCPTGDCPPDPTTTAHPATPAPAPALDPSTFVPPSPLPPPHVTIEFCDRCRWLHRATWTQTELFLTFPPPALKSISLVSLNAPETGGRFRVWLGLGDGTEQRLVWDRKIEGGFPELKVLKQRIRDLVSPEKELGHSDKKEKDNEGEEKTSSACQSVL